MADQSFPEPTTGVFIFNPEGKLLLIRSHKWPGKYVIPGGHVELGERIEQAARREALEETGLEVHDLEFIGWQEFVYDPNFWKPRHFIFFDYACKTESTKVVLNSEGHDHVWVTIDEALKLPVDSYTINAIKAYLAKRGKRVPD